MNRKFSLSLITLIMITTFSTNVFAASNKIRDNNSIKTIEEINSNKINKDIDKSKEIEIKQKLEQWYAIEDQNNIITKSNIKKWDDICTKTKEFKTKPEYNDIIKREALKMKTITIANELKKVSSLDETQQYEINKHSTQKLTNDEEMTYLDKMINTASQRNKALRSIDYESDIIFHILE